MFKRIRYSSRNSKDYSDRWRQARIINRKSKAIYANIKRPIRQIVDLPSKCWNLDKFCGFLIIHNWYDRIKME